LTRSVFIAGRNSLVNKGALIVGGSVAGLQAALDLADSGIEVHLLESSSFIDNKSASTVPRHLLNARILEVSKHSNVTVWTDTSINHVEGNVGRFQVELRRLPRYVDLTKCTGCKDCIEACPVTVPGKEHKAVYILEGSQPECAVIDKMGKSPCADACPGGIHVQGYIALIAQSRFQEALDLIREAIPFPGICGRICIHPCEVNCRRKEVDTPVAIRQLKRFIADWELKNVGKNHTKRNSNPLPVKNANQVAVIGAGPAGLTTAYYLAQKGYKVSVFEKLPFAGGMMAVGIPAYRLPRDILNTEIKVIEKMGVEIKTGVTFGKEITLEGLKSDGFQAVFLATGLHGSRKLGVEGEDSEGVLHGVPFLRDIALGREVSLDNKVIVIGGGNVAIDVAMTARRLGSKDITIVCLETREEMPAWGYEIEEALEEGVKIITCYGPGRFLEKDSRFAGIEFKRCTCVFDDKCNFNPQYDENDLQILESDTAIIAIGQMGELDFAEDEKISISPQGGLEVDPMTLQTSIPWVFAGGDAVYGPKSVIEAIASGKEAADSIDRYLKGQDLKEGRITNLLYEKPDKAETDINIKDMQYKRRLGGAYEVPIARRDLTEDELLPKPRIPVPTLPIQERITSFAEKEMGYSKSQAIAEAQRCLVCGPCSECVACEQACKAKAINHEQREKITEMDIGAIIYADDPEQFARLPLTEGRGVYLVPPESPIMGSAAAAKAMADLFTERRHILIPSHSVSFDEPVRIGVFICRCGDLIASVIDTEAVRKRAAARPGVVHAVVLPFSCSSDDARAIYKDVEAHKLNRVVLAACSCCSIDQVCYSCTFQRIRCKSNLGLFGPQSAISKQPTTIFDVDKMVFPSFEFVNIREQCAWPHAENSQAATDKSAALIAAAVARARTITARQVESLLLERSALIVGNSKAKQTCHETLNNQGIKSWYVKSMPAQIRHDFGHYMLTCNGRTWQASALVLAPKNAEEEKQLIAAFDTNGHQPGIHSTWMGIDTQRPGVFHCDPAMDPEIAGTAAASRVIAWLGRTLKSSEPIKAVIDPERCRACGTCIKFCEFGAPQLVGEEFQRTSRIDSNICTGCGICAAHCPSDAITAGYSTDIQLEAMLDAVLA